MVSCLIATIQFRNSKEANVKIIQMHQLALGPPRTQTRLQKKKIQNHPFASLSKLSKGPRNHIA